jgi:hypothetical protein
MAVRGGESGQCTQYSRLAMQRTIQLRVYRWIEDIEEEGGHSTLLLLSLFLALLAKLAGLPVKCFLASAEQRSASWSV